MLGASSHSRTDLSFEITHLNGAAIVTKGKRRESSMVDGAFLYSVWSPEWRHSRSTCHSECVELWGWLLTCNWELNRGRIDFFNHKPRLCHLNFSPNSYHLTLFKGTAPNSTKYKSAFRARKASSSAQAVEEWTPSLTEYSAGGQKGSFAQTPAADEESWGGGFYLQAWLDLKAQGSLFQIIIAFITLALGSANLSWSKCQLFFWAVTWLSTKAEQALSLSRQSKANFFSGDNVKERNSLLPWSAWQVTGMTEQTFTVCRACVRGHWRHQEVPEWQFHPSHMGSGGAIPSGNGVQVRQKQQVSTTIALVLRLRGDMTYAAKQPRRIKTVM